MKPEEDFYGESSDKNEGFNLVGAGITITLVFLLILAATCSSCTKESPIPSKQVQTTPKELLAIWKPILGTIEYDKVVDIFQPPTLYWSASLSPWVVKGDSLTNDSTYHFVVTSTTLTMDRKFNKRTYHLYYER